MPSEQIDSSSLHALVSGLVRKGGPDWTSWERRATAEVTLGLLFRPRMTIAAPPKSGVQFAGKSLVEIILGLLPEFVSEPKVPLSLKRSAVRSTSGWITANSENLPQAFSLMQSDSSLDQYARWAIERDWPYHVARLGSLIDEPMFHPLARILGFSSKEEKNLRSAARDLGLVRQWSQNLALTGQLPPKEMIDAWLLSALSRGRYYQHLAGLQGGHYIWHPMRNYVLEPVHQLSHILLFSDRLVELYLAGMICRGAMEEESDEQVVVSWAQNLRKLKEHVAVLAKASDSKRAVDLAVDFARQYDLHFRWPRLDAIIERTVEYFVLPLVGIAAGIFTWQYTGSHYLALAAHEGAHFVSRPFVESLVGTIEQEAGKSRPYLEHLAKSGAERVFAVTKEDLQNPTQKVP